MTVVEEARISETELWHWPRGTGSQWRGCDIVKGAGNSSLHVVMDLCTPHC